MNAILFTVLALGGADASIVTGGGPAAVAGSYGGDMGGGECCDECNGGGGGGRHGGQNVGLRSWCGPMPQSCYNPSFGCYPSTRFMHRYPAFHNTYYRAAYNYRQYFDYPWHAGLHEPTSMFSYHVPAEGQGQTVPTPVPAASRTLPTPARSASSANVFAEPGKLQR